MPLYNISEGADGQTRHRNLYYAGLHRKLLLALLPVLGPLARLETKLVVTFPGICLSVETSVLYLNTQAGEPSFSLHRDVYQLGPMERGGKHRCMCPGVWSRAEPKPQVATKSQTGSG